MENLHVGQWIMWTNTFGKSRMGVVDEVGTECSCVQALEGNLNGKPVMKMSYSVHNCFIQPLPDESFACDKSWLIDMALIMGDKTWFYELTSQVRP